MAISIRDLRLVLSEPVARWLLAMLMAVIAPESESALRGPVTRRLHRARPSDGPAVRIRVVVQVYRPGELGRPRWDGSEWIVTAGDLVLRLSASAARELVTVLVGFLDA